MNSRSFVVFAVLAGSWLCAGAFARSSAAEPELVILPQGDFSCLVEVTPDGAGPKPPPAPPPGRHYAAVWKEIAITRVGNTRRDLTTWTDGTISQLWSLDSQDLSLWQGNEQQGKSVYLLRGAQRDGLSARLLRFSAESVSWITKGALVGNDNGAFHYQATVTVPGQVGFVPPRTAIYQAWIDPKTLVPLKFDDGQNLYVLTFAPNVPTGPLDMPPDIRAELTRWQVAMTPHPHVN